MTNSPEQNGAQMNPQTMAQLRQRLQRAWSEWDEAISALTEEELVGLRDEQGWTAKDHIAHVAVWERGLVTVLQGRPRYEGMGMDEATWYSAAPPEGYNDIIYAQYKDRPPEEILLLSRQVHTEMMNALAALSFADLQQTFADRHVAPAGEEEMPILTRLLLTYERHYPEHLALIRQIVAQG